MIRIFASLLAIGASVFWFHPSLKAQDSFYKGKVVRIIVGASAGGGYDTYSRTLARHMGRHIPGQPTLVVENMPGAGFLISANYMFKVAKPDGLTIGHFIGGLFLQQLLEKPGIEFDARRFAYVGVPAQDNNVIGISRKTGIKSIEDWLASKTLVKMGGVGAGSATDDVLKVLIATIGLPAQLVTGYKGTAEIRLAFNSGELQGTSSSWESFKSTWRQELNSGELMIVLQNISQAHRDLPKVPLAISFAKTDEARRLIRALVHSYGATARPYVLPPGTSKDRVQTLQKAFTATVKDSEFLADARKAKLDINPLSGAELERNIHEIFGLDASLVAKAKEILK
ncbi:MAG: Bug family tripartite tricarboxylate transporter substrate binding protein [Candidatus Binatia bacterium]